MRNVLHFAILIFALTLNHPSWAAAEDACSDTRLDENGGSMSKVKVRDQGQFGTCYAHAAAQMYDALRFSNGDTDEYQTSGLMAAVIDGEYSNELTQKYSGTKHRTDVDSGGGACSVMGAISQKGVCTEDACISEMGNHRKHSSLYRFIEQSAQLQTSLKTNKARTAKVKSFVTQEACTLSNEGYPISQQSLDKIESLIKTGDQIDLLSEFKKIVCSGTNYKKPYKLYLHNSCSNWSKYEGTLQASEIHRLLKQKNAQPIYVSFCSNLLKKGRYYRGQYKNANDTNCGRHGALIIGQRRNPKTQRCDFLIRNSWGTDPAYSSDWEAKDGNVWVDGNDLMNNTYSMNSYMK